MIAVIEPIIVPFFGTIGETIICIDDYSRSHWARIGNDRIEYPRITRMDCLYSTSENFANES